MTQEYRRNHNLYKCFCRINIVMAIIYASVLYSCAHKSNEPAVDDDNNDINNNDNDIDCDDADECSDGIEFLPMVDNGDGTVTDPNTDLMWDKNLSRHCYCDPCYDSTLAGYNDWEVPSIDELRSLIRGCPYTEICGECKPSVDCIGITNCAGCEQLTDKCYWDPVLAGRCNDDFYVSYTKIYGNNLLIIDFTTGGITHAWEGLPFNHRCVRRIQK